MRPVGTIYPVSKEEITFNANLESIVPLYKAIDGNLEKMVELSGLYTKPGNFTRRVINGGIEYYFVKGSRKNSRKLCHETRHGVVFSPRDSDELQFGLKQAAEANLNKIPIDLTRSRHSYFGRDDRYFGRVPEEGPRGTTISPVEIYSSILAFNSRIPDSDLTGEFTPASEDSDDVETDILCQRDITYQDRHVAAHKQQLKLRALIRSAKTKLGPLIDELKESVNGGITSKIEEGVLLPAPQDLLHFSDVSNHYSLERIWEQGLTFEDVSKLSKALLNVVKSGLFKELRFRMDTSMRNWLASKLKIGHPVSSSTGSLKVVTTSAQSGDYLVQGTTELALGKEENSLDVFQILPLINKDGLVLKATLLLDSANRSFVLDSDDMLDARGCSLGKFANTSNVNSPPMCDLTNLPISSVSMKCAEALLSERADDCEMVKSHAAVVAYRTQCERDGPTRSIVSAAETTKIQISCPGQPTEDFEIHAGSNVLLTNCQISYNDEILLETDPSNAHLFVPDALPESPILVGQNRDLAIGFGAFGSGLMFLKFLYFIYKLKANDWNLSKMCSSCCKSCCRSNSSNQRKPQSERIVTQQDEQEMLTREGASAPPSPHAIRRSGSTATLTNEQTNDQ